MNNLTKKYRIIIGSILIVLTSISLFAIIHNTKITSKDYTIKDVGYIQVAVNRDIDKMSNIEYILDDVIENYSFGSLSINDSKYCLALISSKPSVSVVAVYENIGTVNNPRRGNEISNKTRELSQFIEKYNQKTR